ncbi:hypothetical protein AAG906_013838 [Vitis piasezkii]
MLRNDIGMGGVDVLDSHANFIRFFSLYRQICSAYGVERSKDKKGFISFMNMCILSDYWKFCLLLHEEGFPLMEEMKETRDL